MRQPVPFGKYLLLDRISVGGMAEVFKAKSYGVEGFEKIIAIKRILPTMGEDRDFIKMFIDEAKIAGQLAHANICQIFELGRIDGSHFIAMEYIWGKDLLQIQNRIRKLKQQMPVPMACFAIAKVLEGLDYAHRKRDAHSRPLEIVHRDCSPQNVLVSYEGEVKVIDFGIAKATSRNSRTMAGVLKGKFGYMSPEQVRGLPLDRRSDIFAIGTMLYECLTGERLFMGETDFSTLEKVRNVDIQPPRALNPAIPEEVERVILKALAKDVDDRYQWCSEMLVDLQQYLMAEDVVYTAKSVSSWLKDIFAQEIERERAQLEQYKRVGRDGLIGGLPSAEADRDVVSHLGEAPAPEGDATTLGGPSFDDIEQAAGAAPSVGPPPRSESESESDSGHALRDSDNEFAEEGPTEIFGGDDETLEPPSPARAPAAAPSLPSLLSSHEQPAVAARATRAHGSQDRTSAPRTTSQRPAELASAPSASPPGGSRDLAPGPAPAPPSAPSMAYAERSSSAGMQYPANPPYAGSDPGGGVANGTPGAFPAGQQARTALGMQAPSNSSFQYQPNEPQPPQNGSYPQYPQYPSQSYGVAPTQGYPGSVATPHEPMLAAESKRSTLVRDVAIGVLIAAVVLGGFFVVKFVILDKSDPPATTSALATIQLSMTPGVAADLYVDGNKKGSFTDQQKVPTSAGPHRLMLLGPGGRKCVEPEPVMLEAGRITMLRCDIGPIGSDAGSAAVVAGSDAGSAAAASTSGSGAGSATGSGSNAGSAAATSGSAAATSVTAGSGAGSTAPLAGSNAGSAASVPTPGAATGVAMSPDRTVVRPKPVMPMPMPVPRPAVVAKPEAAKAPDTTGKGFLTITSKPVAKIAVDGVDTGMSTPISGKALALTPGKHRITFGINDDRYSFPITIVAGQTQTLNKDLE